MKRGRGTTTERSFDDFVLDDGGGVGNVVIRIDHPRGMLLWQLCQQDAQDLIARLRRILRRRRA